MLQHADWNTRKFFKHFSWKFTGIIVMYLVNYTSELFKGALNNNWNNSWVNKKSDIFTKTQKLGRIDRFQVSVSWILEFLKKKKWYKRDCPPWKLNFKFKNSICGRSLFHFQIQYHEAGKLIQTEQTCRNWATQIEFLNVKTLKNFGLRRAYSYFVHYDSKSWIT